MPAMTLLPHLMEALYRKPHWSNQIELARELETSSSAVAPWVRTLNFHRAISVRREGLMVDRDRLIRIYTSFRVATLRPVKPFGTPLDVESAKHQLDGANIDHIFALFTAANRYAFFEPRNEIQIYVKPGSLTSLRQAIATDKPGRGDLLVQAFEEPLEGIAQTSRNGLAVTTPLQTVVDLRAHPEGGAHAEFLSEKLLPKMVAD